VEGALLINPNLMWNRPDLPIILLLLSGLLLLMASKAPAQTLEGIVVPADTFAPGPTSGQFITTANGRIPPFVAKQPVQGISAVLHGLQSDSFAMEDNGFGAKGNSANFVLRVYHVQPD